MCYHASTPEKKGIRAMLHKKIKIEDYEAHYHVAGFDHPEMPVMLMEEADQEQPVVWGFISEKSTPQSAVEFQDTHTH